MLSLAYNAIALRPSTLTDRRHDARRVHDQQLAQALRVVRSHEVDEAQGQGGIHVANPKLRKGAAAAQGAGKLWQGRGRVRQQQWLCQKLLRNGDSESSHVKTHILVGRCSGWVCAD